MLSWFKRGRSEKAEIVQTQKSGTDSTLTQIGQQIINVGVDEKRVREIFDEKYALAIDDLSKEAYAEASKRVSSLGSQVIDKISARKLDLAIFSDPKFQREITKAQSSAAASDRKSDIEMLSELLVARMDGTLQRKTHTGISRAIEIVSDIDDDELTALTVVYAVSTFSPHSAMFGSSMTNGLALLDDLFHRLNVQALPEGDGWMENLNMLDAIILSPLGGFKKIIDYYAENMNGYVCIGLEEGTPNFSEAKKILLNAGLPLDMLVRNEFMNGYVRIPLVKQSECEKVQLFRDIPGAGTSIHIPVKPTEVQVAALKDVLGLYKKDQALMEQMMKAFSAEWQKYPSLVIMQKWMDGLKKSFDITKVGKALAYTNARRCAPSLPALNLE